MLEVHAKIANNPIELWEEFVELTGVTLFIAADCIDFIIV